MIPGSAYFHKRTYSYSSTITDRCVYENLHYLKSLMDYLGKRNEKKIRMSNFGKGGVAGFP